MNWFYGSFVDRDMVMRYHFGLGVGHVYSHQSAAIHLPTPQVASSSYANRTTVIADASGFHLGGSGSANNQDATEPGHAEFEDSDDEDEDFEDEDFEDGDFEDFESDILGSDSSNESDGDFDGGDIDNVDLEELAAEEMYYN